MVFELLGKKFMIVCPQHPDKICSLIKFSLAEENVLIEIELGDDSNKKLSCLISINTFDKFNEILETEQRVSVEDESTNHYLFFKMDNGNLYFGYRSSGNIFMDWRLLKELN